MLPPKTSLKYGKIRYLYISLNPQHQERAGDLTLFEQHKSPGVGGGRIIKNYNKPGWAYNNFFAP